MTGQSKLGGYNMKKVGKPIFFIVAILILFLFVTSVFGISEQYGLQRDLFEGRR